MGDGEVGRPLIQAEGGASIGCKRTRGIRRGNGDRRADAEEQGVLIGRVAEQVDELGVGLVLTVREGHQREADKTSRHIVRRHLMEAVLHTVQEKPDQVVLGHRDARRGEVDINGDVAQTRNVIRGKSPIVAGRLKVKVAGIGRRQITFIFDDFRTLLTPCFQGKSVSRSRIFKLGIIRIGANDDVSSLNVDGRSQAVMFSTVTDIRLQHAIPRTTRTAEEEIAVARVGNAHFVE